MEDAVEISRVDLRDPQDVGVDLSQGPGVARIDRPAGGILYRRVAIARSGSRVHGESAQQVEDADDLQSWFSSVSTIVLLGPSRVNSRQGRLAAVFAGVLGPAAARLRTRGPWITERTKHQERRSKDSRYMI